MLFCNPFNTWIYSSLWDVYQSMHTTPVTNLEHMLTIFNYRKMWTSWEHQYLYSDTQSCNWAYTNFSLIFPLPLTGQSCKPLDMCACLYVCAFSYVKLWPSCFLCKMTLHLHPRQLLVPEFGIILFVLLLYIEQHMKYPRIMAWRVHELNRGTKYPTTLEC